jgi:DNA-binding beta-propeller fold protein YncE
MTKAAVTILREYGPFDTTDEVAGVTFDGNHVWFASGDRINAMDPASGRIDRAIEVPAHAGTAFDGKHLYQLAASRIQKIDPATGRVLATIELPGGGSGLAWAEGALWVGQYQKRKIIQIDPETGDVLRTIDSNCHVTGVSWVDGELWHATWEGEESELRQVDPATGKVLEQLEMPKGTMISGLESDGADRFFCGGGKSGKLRAVQRPKRKVAARA